MKIIDFHSHLGDILNLEGGKLIDKKNVKKTILLDMISVAESQDHDMFGLENASYKAFGSMVVKAERARNATATLENCKASMNEAGIIQTVCLPIPPYLNFEDLINAQQKFSGIIPFTGVDFTLDEDLDKKFEKDIEQGAQGLKIHSNIQKVALTDERVKKAVAAFEKYKKPVLFHCGVSSYYLGKEKEKENPEFGRLEYARELVQEFPNVPFVAGHSGMYQVKDTMRLLKGFPNVWVDTSFQPVKRIKQLIDVFGENRILFGSDWPYGSRMTALRIMRKVCADNQSLAEKIFYLNAERLLNGEW